jgi:penicillin-binding protein 1C
MRKTVKTAMIIPAFFFLAWLALLLTPYPELKNYRGRPYGFKVLDRNGRMLRVFPAEDGVKRVWVPLKEIPPGAVKIFLQAEDRRFYFHCGVDPLAAASAALRNLSAGRVVSGASTITMQLARLVKPGRRGFKGKIAEALDAMRIEARLSKKQILELWMNGIPFGSNIEGISAITRARFGRDIGELDDARALLLAVIPRRPALYDPAVNPEAAVKTAAALARKCVPDISEAALEEAAAETAPQSGAAEKNPFFAPHFTERAAALHDGGRQPLRATLDWEIQSYAERRLAEELSLLENNRVSNGAVLAVNNVDGSVLVYAGSGSWFDDSANGKIDGVQVENQPGSCLKPFLYALALEKGFNPNDVLPDIPTVFGSSEAYSPSNFNRRFNGPVRFRVAIASSLNLPAVYLIEKLGVNSFEDYLIGLGFSSISRTRGTAGLGLALGNSGVSLEELVRAFTVFPNLGQLRELRFIDKPLQGESPARQVMPRDDAWLIADILSDRGSRVVGFGTARVFSAASASLFKTGTANQFQHIWALGATKRFTVGVWMGNFSGETVVGRTGSSVPARIASDLLRALALTFPTDETEESGADRPANLRLTEICALSGMTASPACSGLFREWINPQRLPASCSWHGNGLKYPPEYQAWLRERSRSGSAPPSGGGAYIRIPASGSVFFFDPALPYEAQAIRVETAGFAPDALVYCDDLLQGSLNQAGVIALPLYRGRHRIAVEDGNGAAASVEIEVR